jgi:hypothetical protein
MKGILFGLIVASWICSSMASPEAKDEVGPDRWPSDCVVFHCTFDQSRWDKNFDHWPDRWKRHQGPGYPVYLEMKRIDDPDAPGGGAFWITLDGGAAAAFSPLIPVRPVYAYVLEVFVKTQGLRHHQAYVSLEFLDAKLQVLGRQESDKLTGTRNWQTVRVGPVAPEWAQVHWVRIGLHVEPGQQADWKGEVGFADVWLGQLPRLKMWVQPRTHLFSQHERVEIFCEASGFSNPACQIEWQLYDVWGRILSRQLQTLPTEPVAGNGAVPPGEASAVGPVPEPNVAARRAEKTAEHEFPGGANLARLSGSKESSGRNATQAFSETAKANPAAQGKPAPVEPTKQALVYRSQTVWRPSLPGPGFYRVGCRLVGISARTPPCQLDFGVLGPGFSGKGGEFGWSLPAGDHPLSLEELASLLSQMGLRWVKYPVWFDPKADAEKIEAWVVFSERLNAQGMEMVGLLARPPASVAKQFAAQTPLAADIFAMDPARWWPVVEPVLLRLAPRIRWWQLGLDDDQSFVGLPRLEEKLRQVKAHWEKVGKDLQIGFGWDWVQQLPRCGQGPAPWKFLTFRSQPPLTAEELTEALAGSASSGLVRWVAVEPLPKQEYPLEERAADLVRQMAAAKIAGADAIFLPDPFHPETGLMHPDGTAAELLLVWRTLAQALSGARYLGTLPMPNRSPNYLFLRGKEALLILWNQTPTEEVLYLGENVAEVDLWGRSTPVAPQGELHRLQVGRLPKLVSGLDPLVAQWRIGCQMATGRIPSLFGRPHPNRLQMHNPLDRGVSGVAKLIVPAGWTAQPEEIPFRLGPGETLEAPFSLTLPYTATNGRYPLVVDIRLQADRPYAFQVHRWLEVGLGDVYIQIATRLNAHQELEVEQRLVNETEQAVAFECQLFAPGRKRLRTHVYLSGPGQEVFTYRLPDGEELVGKTLWLQAVELGGSRVLTYRFSIPPPEGAPIPAADQEKRGNMLAK